MGKIEKAIKNVNMDQKTEWILCRYLGYHPIVEEIIYKQIIELSR